LPEQDVKGRNPVGAGNLQKYRFDCLPGNFLNGCPQNCRSAVLWSACKTVKDCIAALR
jgi:hypothetical protein